MSIFLKRTDIGRQVLDTGKFDPLQHVRLNTEIGDTSSLVSFGNAS